METTNLRIDRKTEHEYRGFAVRDAEGEIVAWIRKETKSSPVYAGGSRHSVGSTRYTRYVVRDASGRNRIDEAKTQAKAIETLARRIALGTIGR